MKREMRTIRQIEMMLVHSVRSRPRCGELQAVSIERCRSDIGPNWRLLNFNPGGGPFSDVLTQLTQEARRLGRLFDVGEHSEARRAAVPPELTLSERTFGKAVQQHIG
ncbi:hypothetical protein [Chelatococcus asaccharovorans]|uniref:hypothetical protein n=1 Tax=Chelatococcus asaccharovorans TaxID=28210 RepID=UPI00224C7726|nr:hypothetical protein [Chelatococcus asaccharovorans]CAH1672137.1 conserved hypothetical protein [Chelatococcus asaccharovorans]CAH1676455.1 conserved hypothetical protein [Chelatococcus asaccharovorans]